MSGAVNFITDKMKAKPRGDIARAAVAAYGAATWGRERVVAILSWCGLPDGVIRQELERRAQQRKLARERANEAARLRRLKAKEERAAVNVA